MPFGEDGNHPISPRMLPVNVHAAMMPSLIGGTMKTKMTHAIRKEFTNAIRGRYAAAANKDKRRILEEFVAATGYHEKSAIRVLNTPPEPKRRQTRQRLSIYDEAARGALIVLWEASDRVCGKRLKALLPILLPALERNGHLKLEMEIRGKILSMALVQRFRGVAISSAKIGEG
jgi:hypothetical protein